MHENDIHGCNNDPVLKESILQVLCLLDIVKVRLASKPLSIGVICVDTSLVKIGRLDEFSSAIDNNIGVGNPDEDRCHFSD